MRLNSLTLFVPFNGLESPSLTGKDVGRVGNPREAFGDNRNRQLAVS